MYWKPVWHILGDVLITPGNVEDLPEAETAETPHRRRRSRQVGDRTPPGRSALLGEPGPGPATAPNEGRPVRRRPVGAPPGRRPWRERRATRRGRRARTRGNKEHEGQVEVTSKNRVEMAWRDGVDRVLSTMLRGWHPTARLWRRTSSSLVRLGNVQGHPDKANRAKHQNGSCLRNRSKRKEEETWTQDGTC